MFDNTSFANRVLALQLANHLPWIETIFLLLFKSIFCLLARGRYVQSLVISRMPSCLSSDRSMGEEPIEGRRRICHTLRQEAHKSDKLDFGTLCPWRLTARSLSRATACRDDSKLSVGSKSCSDRVSWDIGMSETWRSSLHTCGDSAIVNNGDLSHVGRALLSFLSSSFFWRCRCFLTRDSQTPSNDDTSHGATAPHFILPGPKTVTRGRTQGGIGGARGGGGGGRLIPNFLPLTFCCSSTCDLGVCLCLCSRHRAICSDGGDCHLTPSSQFENVR